MWERVYVTYSHTPVTHRDDFLAVGQKGGAPSMGRYLGVVLAPPSTGTCGVWPVVAWRLNVRRMYTYWKST
mgnify:CR=1 FL=1